MAKTRATKKVKKSEPVDPTTLSVVWSRFESILDEMGEKVLHATQSFVMANVRDLGQVLLDPQGHIVAVSCYVVSHIFKSTEVTQNVIKYFKNKFDPGDFIIANAYTMKTIGAESRNDEGTRIRGKREEKKDEGTEPKRSIESGSGHCSIFRFSRCPGGVQELGLWRRRKCRR